MPPPIRERVPDLQRRALQSESQRPDRYLQGSAGRHPDRSGVSQRPCPCWSRAGYGFRLENSGEQPSTHPRVGRRSGAQRQPHLDHGGQGCSCDCLIGRLAEHSYHASRGECGGVLPSQPAHSGRLAISLLRPQLGPDQERRARPATSVARSVRRWAHPVDGRRKRFAAFRAHADRQRSEQAC